MPQNYPAQFTIPLNNVASVLGITATANSQSALFTIFVSGLTGYSSMTVFRVVESTGHSEPIRGGNNVTLAGQDTYLLSDVEAPLGEMIHYQVILDGGTNAISNSDFISTDGLTCWLKDVIEGVNSTPIKITEMGAVSRKARNLGSFDVINRQNPVLVNDVRSGRSGSFKAMSDGDADAIAIRNLIATGNTILLQTPASANFPDMFFQAGDIDEEWMGPFNSGVHIFSIPFTEVDTPSLSAYSLPQNSWLLVTQFDSWAQIASSRTSWKDVFLAPFNPSTDTGFDGTFEAGDTLVWSNLTGCTLITSTDFAHNGLRSGKTIVSGSPTTMKMRAVPMEQSIIVGNSYTVGGWAYSPSAVVSNTQMAIDFRDSGGTLVSGVATTITLNPGVWTYIEITANAPATTTQLNYGPTLSGSPANGTTVYWDDIVFIRN